MQDVINYCFIDQIVDFKTNLFLLDENYNILQYKILNKKNSTKLNNIYCGIIEKVDYGIESLFVRVEKNIVGFLPFRQLSDFSFERVSLFKKGDKILVQVIRDSLDSKSLKLTNDISISNVFCVLMPFSSEQHGISSNIKADQRVLLKSLLHSLDVNGTLILRTAAFDASVDEIKKDYLYIKNLFHLIMKKFMNAKSFCLLFQYDELLNFLRSYSKLFIDTVFVRNKSLYDLVKKYNDQKFIKFPEIRVKNDFAFLKHIEDQVASLYKTELFLPSNGSIVIEKTEAMVTIDVNSGRGVKCSNMEDTALKINLEAAELIVNQIILRNLGGIIAVDLIDLQLETNRLLIYDKFKQCFKRDKVSVKVLPMNELSVLHISRERKGLSLIDMDLIKCSNCMNGFCFSLNYWENLFLQSLSKFHCHSFLLISMNSHLFHSIYSKYINILNNYTNLHWNIQELQGFNIKEKK